MKCFWLECPSLFIKVDHFALQERRLSDLHGGTQTESKSVSNCSCRQIVFIGKSAIVDPETGSICDRDRFAELRIECRGHDHGGEATFATG
jgi:hypothetical protein